MKRKIRPSRFPADTDPSLAGHSIHSGSLAAISIERKTTGLTGCQIRLWGKLKNKAADRLGGVAAIFEVSLVGVVPVLFGGCLGGSAPPGGRKELLLLGVPVSNDSLLISGDVSGVV